MNSFTKGYISPDDPIVTAFALGELEGSERDRVEAAVAANPDLQQLVAEIRNTGADLASALASESLAEVENTHAPRPYRAADRIVRFPYWLAAGSVVAASLTVMVVVNQRTLKEANDAHSGRAIYEVSSVPKLPEAGEGYKFLNDGRFVETASNPESTFALRVGAKNYAEVTEAIRGGTRPAPGSVKVEELLNHFEFSLPEAPNAPEVEFAASMEIAVAPWAPANRLVLIGIKARDDAGNDSSMPIARNVSVSVQFNPLRVLSYRLIGFENPPLPNPKGVDQGSRRTEIFAGHSVAALYEIVPTGLIVPPTKLPEASHQKSRNLVVASLRYDNPVAHRREEISVSTQDHGGTFLEASDDFKLAAAVAGFGMVLNDSAFAGNTNLTDVAAWARQGTGADPKGQRAEFVDLVLAADRLPN